MIFNKFIYPLPEFRTGMPLCKHKIGVAVGHFEVEVKFLLIILATMAYLYRIGIEFCIISA